jgi:hypothetical protein
MWGWLSEAMTFLSEALAEPLGADLDRHLAVETRIRGAVDFAHTAGGHERFNPVRAQGLAGLERGG